MAAACSACSSDSRREIERRLRSGTSLVDVARWLREAEPPGISRQALSRHASKHMALPPRTSGPRPVSGDFLKEVVAVAGERMAAGEIAPGVRDGISAQVALDNRAARVNDHELMLKMAMILNGHVPSGYINGSYLEDDEAAEDERELRLLTEGASPTEVAAGLADWKDKRADEARARLR